MTRDDDVVALNALEPPPASIRDVRARMGWGATRAGAALRAWREQAEDDDLGAAPDDGPGAVDLEALDPGTLRGALEQALRAVGTAPEHAPTVALARRYAAVLDSDPESIARLGRAYLSTLMQLRLTPGTRSAVADPAAAGGEDGQRSDELDELRERRDRRAYRAPDLDPATP